MANKNTHGWNLESLLDSMIVELDKVQDTLSVKAVNRPLTYTVKDVAFDLHIFPQFDGQTVRFSTAKPGETGASKISIQLGSITDRQVRETTKNPITKDDISLDLVEDIDEKTKSSLRKIGVTSVKDIEKIENKNIDLEKVSKKNINFQNLVNIINKARRKKLAPKVSKISMSKSAGKNLLSIKGKNLALFQSSEGFPSAEVNFHPAKVIAATDREMSVEVTEHCIRAPSNQLKVVLDPYTIFTIELKS